MGLELELRFESYATSSGVMVVSRVTLLLFILSSTISGAWSE